MNTCDSCGHENIDDARFCAICGGPLSLAEGATIEDGRYDLIEQLGVGGMGEVWRATDTRLDRPVALKFLNPELLAHPTARKRMLREAKALSRVNHANVVGIHDQFEHSGKVVLALELVEGGDLEGLLSSGVLPWRKACDIAAGILRGLDAIHGAGLVHRDLKPGNVLMDGETPKITDLGVAHDTGGRSLTRTGARLGTPSYMSPEQIRGKEIDVRSDIYAMGILLYEMLVGEVPFTGDTDFDVEKGHVEVPPDLDRLPSEVPLPLRQLLARALEKAPADRFESAATMEEAVGVALTGVMTPPVRPPDPGPTTTPPERPPRVEPAQATSAEPAWKNPSIVGGASFLACALLFFLIFGSSDKRAEHKAPQVSAAPAGGAPAGGAPADEKKAWDPSADKKNDSAKKPAAIGDKGNGYKVEAAADWYCICYRERVSGVATNCTGCRQTRDQCDELSEAADSGLRSFVTNSVSRGCTGVHGTHPGDSLGGQYKWKPSAFAGAWWSTHGCLLPSSRDAK